MELVFCSIMLSVQPSTCTTIRIVLYADNRYASSTYDISLTVIIDDCSSVHDTVTCYGKSVGGLGLTYSLFEART